MTFAIFSFIFTFISEILGFSRMIIASMFATFIPAFFSLSLTSLRSSMLLAPLSFASVSGKCSPISPSPAAPSIASIMLWHSTSPSECASIENSQGILMPPSIISLPGTSLCTSYPMPVLILCIPSSLIFNIRKYHSACCRL